MKHIIVSMILAASHLSFAGGWVTISDAGTQYGPTVYKSKSTCEAREGERCVDRRACELDECSVQSVMVDDPSRPLYGPELKVQGGFADLPACQAAQVGHCDDQDPGYGVEPKCADDGGTFRLYCIAIEPRSYEQMAQDQLLPDAVKQAAKAQAESDRITLEANVRQQARDCMVLHRDGSPTAGEVRACQRTLFRVLRDLMRAINE